MIMWHHGGLRGLRITHKNQPFKSSLFFFKATLCSNATSDQMGAAYHKKKPGIVLRQQNANKTDKTCRNHSHSAVSGHLFIYFHFWVIQQNKTPPLWLELSLLIKVGSNAWKQKLESIFDPGPKPNMLDFYAPTTEMPEELKYQLYIKNFV